MTDSRFAWEPSAEVIARSRLKRFMDRYSIRSLAELQARSTEDIAWFWDAVVRDLGLEFYQPYSQVVDLSRGPEWTTWFGGGRFNYVHNALDRRAIGPDADKPALVYESEQGDVRRYTYRQLWQETNRVAQALRALGVNRGDRVGLFMPMIPEAVIGSLACGKIGAIYVPIFSGLGAQSVAERLSGSECVVVLTADGFTRRGAPVEMKQVADEAVAGAPSVKQVLVATRLGGEVPWQSGRDVRWEELVPGQLDTFETERTVSEDPFMIIYTSGTTGRPKGAVHTHAGFPIKASQDMAHCFDVQEADRLFWITDMGWMMGPWAVIGTLTLGGTLVIYDGAIDYPGPDRLWSVVETHQVTVLGISPTAVRALMRYDVENVHKHNLASLRAFGTTGEPWNPDPWWWLFREVGRSRCPILNYSGGTEIAGGIVSGNPLTPCQPCAFSGPVPGMAADVVDENCQPVRGNVGELVIRKPWVGMTRGFWRDPQRYLDTYWSRWPGVWVHGDWASIDADGFWYIQGRSDDTIKVAGKRLGPAEVESAAVSHPAVLEAAAIGVPDELKGEAVVCFTILKPGYSPSEPLRSEIQGTITHILGKAMAPKAVKFVSDLPKTRNAKIMRRLIRARYLGRTDLGDTSSLENPKALDEVANAL